MLSIMMRIAGLGLLGLLLAALTGCASSPEIRSDYDAAADFNAYKTFAFMDKLGTDKRGYSTLVTGHFKRATRHEMEARGYRYSESDPDLLINFAMSLKEKTELRGTALPARGTIGYYNYRRGYYTVWPVYEPDLIEHEYTAGTASVDVVDARRKQLVWEAVAEGRVSQKAMENPGQSIDKVVAEMFSRYPRPVVGN